jgi:hypothetical protein
MTCPRVVLVGVLCLAVAGCGGGSGSPPPPPIPSTPDFSIAVQPANLSLVPGLNSDSNSQNAAEWLYRSDFYNCEFLASRGDHLSRSASADHFL